MPSVCTKIPHKEVGGSGVAILLCEKTRVAAAEKKNHYCGAIISGKQIKIGVSNLSSVIV